jgi:hypothetical protein
LIRVYLEIIRYSEKPTSSKIRSVEGVEGLIGTYRAEEVNIGGLSCAKAHSKHV